MIVRSLSACLVASSICLAWSVSEALAARSSDSLLPATTKGYVCVPDLGQLVDHFKRSQWGQLVNDPVMQPFVESIKGQLRQTGFRQLEQFGLTWQDVETVPGGEMALAVIQPAAGEVALVLVIDVTGHRAQAEALVAKATDHLARNGANDFAAPRAIRSSLSNFPTMRVGSGRRWLRISLQGDLLVAGDNTAVLESMLAAVSSGREDSLRTLKAYHEIMAHLQTVSGEDGRRTCAGSSSRSAMSKRCGSICRRATSTRGPIC